MDLYDIIEAIEAGRKLETFHAIEESRNDRLSVDEIWSSISAGEIIEDYPDDRPHPSCLIFGLSPDGSPVHTVVAYDSVEGWAILVTVYRPDPNRWIEWRERRR